MTVYVVTKGRYSDYHVVAICSTSEKANEAERLLQGNAPEKFELDAMPDRPPGLWPYYVIMDVDGNADAEDAEAGSMQDEPRPYGDDKRMGFSVWATDQAHAVKIANEQRSQLIASGKWETDWTAWKPRGT